MKQKGAATDALARWSELDSGISTETGKRVFYQLTDEEGGAIITPEEEAAGRTLPNRKCPAFIDFEYPEGTRGPTGSQVASLTIFRPICKGGLFQKDKVEGDGSRPPGTYDQIQPGDLAG